MAPSPSSAFYTENVNRVRSNLAPGGSNHKTQLLSGLHNQQYQYLVDTLRKCFTEQKSYSVFLMGPSNSGKSTLAERALKTVAEQHSGTPHAVVRINGMICSSFRLAIDSICKQLGKTEELEALLSSSSHFDERLPEVLQFLRESVLASKLVLVLILDNIDLFCEHKGQALLYNIMDAVQSREGSIFAIGITTRQDVLELLEKRVKSRFSHRILTLEPPSLTEYTGYARLLISLDNCPDWNLEIAELFSQPGIQATFQHLYDMDSRIGALVCFLYTVMLQCEKGIKSGLNSVSDESMISDRIKQILDFNFVELVVLMHIKKFLINEMPVFKISDLWKQAEKTFQQTGLNKNDLIFALKALENLELVTAVDKKSASKMDRSYKSEILVGEIMDACKLIPDLPTEIRNII